MTDRDRMKDRDLVAAHLAEHDSVVQAVADRLQPSIVDMGARMLAAVTRGRTLLFCGNGGSAADAQHLAAEYVVRFRRERRPVSAIALTTDTSVLTASGNDYGFEDVFARQVRALGRPGDLLVLHSTSGESENMLRAAGAARESEIETIGLLAKNGGRLASLVDLAVVVPTDSTARAQEIHMLIGHVVCDLIDRTLASTHEPSTSSQFGSE